MNAGRATAVALLLLACHGARAQWGIHAMVLAESSSSLQGSGVPTMVAIGYQHDTSPRTAWSLDVLLSTKVGNGNGERNTTITDNSGGRAQYTTSPTIAGLRYKSYAFLASNEEAAGYLAVSAGATMHRLSCVRRNLSNSDPADDAMPTEISSTKVVFPLCLHLGVRGDLRYLYVDWHTWCGYQVLGGRPILGDGYSMRTTGLDGISGDVRPTGITFGMGFAMGLGSDGKRRNK